MPIKSDVQLRNVANVAASKTVIIDIPCGPRYHYIVLEHGYASGTNTIAGALANITEIRIKRNGVVYRTFSGVQLRDYNIRNGTAYDCLGLPNTAPGISIPIYFAEPWMADEADQDAGAWVTNGWSSFVMEVDLGAASTPTLVASARIDGSTVGQLNGITEVLRGQIGAAGTSFDISTLDRRGFLRSIQIYPDSGATNKPSKVTFRANGAVIAELTYSANLAKLTNLGLTPAASGRTASIYDLVFDSDGLLASAFPMDGLKDVTLTIESASAMSGTTTYLLSRFVPLA